MNVRETFSIDVDTIYDRHVGNLKTHKSEEDHHHIPLSMSSTSGQYIPFVAEFTLGSRVHFSQVPFSQLWHKIQRIISHSMSSIKDQQNPRYGLRARDISKVRQDLDVSSQLLV